MYSDTLKDWAADGHFFKTGPLDLQVFYKDYGNPEATPAQTLLLIHGFPESSFSFHKVMDGLSEIFDRIVLFDLPGFGLSDKPDEKKYTYSLFEHADIALQVWKHVGVRGGHLLGHDMGDSVCTELLARHVQNILPGWFSGGFQSFTFTNGSMVVELAHLRIMQKVLLSPFGKWLGWLSTYPVFRHQVRSAHGNDTLGEQDIERLWENLTLQNGHRKNHLLIRYYKDRIRFERPRWLPALRLAGVPVHFCWGEDDQVAQMPMPHYLQKNYCPAATVTIMPGVGHFCQLGSPTLWVEKVGDFYKKIRT